MRTNDGWEYSSKVVACVDALSQSRKKKITHGGVSKEDGRLGKETSQAVGGGRKYEGSAKPPTAFLHGHSFTPRPLPYLETVLCSIN